MSEYRHDVYVGYAGGGHVERWVVNHLAPELEAWLRVLGGRVPAIALGPAAVEAGPEISPALVASRVMVAIWSPDYFANARCVAEWRATAAREAALGMASVDNPHTLLHPIVFAAPERFPDAARSRQCHDFRAFAVPHAAYRDTPEYLAFSARVRSLSEVLAVALSFVPEWSEGRAGQ